MISQGTCLRTQTKTVTTAKGVTKMEGKSLKPVEGTSTRMANHKPVCVYNYMKLNNFYFETVEDNYDEFHNNLGIAYEKTGRFSDAVAEFEEALQLNPQNMNAKKQSGQSHEIFSCALGKGQ
jgi:tetratricopeptide (TPR) repeat protein